MKKIVLITLFCLTAMFQIQAQNKAKQDTPDKQITVNRQYDENGNLIQYDSTYVHQWSSDSTFNFPFNEHFAFGGNIEEILHHFIGDSAMANFGFQNGFQFSPFDDDFLNPMMTDSTFAQRFHMHPDSLFNFHRMFPNHLHNIEFPDLKALQKQLEDEIDLHGYNFPEFKSQEQKEEWDRLMQKHQKEKEELLNKWNSKESRKL